MVFRRRSFTAFAMAPAITTMTIATTRLGSHATIWLTIALTGLVGPKALSASCSVISRMK